jgi:hypothetical protein
MTFFYSLDFFSSFFSCTKVHPDVVIAAVAAERSLFIHIR